MLRVAIPNKGSLSEPAVAMMKEAGYAQRRESKELTLTDHDNGVEFFYLRPRDVAVYVGSGTVDVGITGRDLMLDSHSEAAEIMPMGFGGSTFRFAARAGAMSDISEIHGRRVATSYPGLVRDYLAERGIEADVVRLDGAVETSITLGVADVIADVVETGTTLRNAGLEVFGDPILRSEAVLIRSANPQADADAENQVQVLCRRLQGVLVARQYVVMDYDCPVALLDRAVALTPGLESPTISPLHDKAWVAVRSMVPRRATNLVMDQLYGVGARGILVTDIAACRL
ncbi:ATP phosphoribosyltransferase [Arsenicicoccus piscis]|uniref:ATP phosphoribosyltransferase n=1 Tax=Arsenicicoccus piscis TaxID=673954 RepID=A0ABQ6HLE9_9MICO|nr:ATP phosphoribosyltransferase [Arsenicicoccus piscis]MCH8626817.1 ATP phosphoribosyltransferase [Arsenicicoccus piscis]GMA19284.1 ATP phosphoribosyltransferase [Arsenicicoccus piscis]